MKEKRTPLHNRSHSSYSDFVHNVIHLQSFRSVAITGSVRSAAHSLGLSPSAVSHHLKLLEQDTGLALFQRHGRGLSLTDTGHAILGEVDSVLEASSHLSQRIGDLTTDRVHRLSIGYFGTAGARWLPELVSFLENKYPHTAVQLNLTEGDWRAQKSDIQLTVSKVPQPEFPEEFVSSFLIADPYVVAVGEDHELATRDTVSLSDIEQYPWIDNEVNDGVCREVLGDTCARAGVQVGFKHQAHSYATALHLVSRGLGVTILPQLGIDLLPAGVKVLRITHPEPVRYIHVLSDPGHPQQAVIGDAIRALKELAHEDFSVTN